MTNFGYILKWIFQEETKASSAHRCASQIFMFVALIQNNLRTERFILILSFSSLWHGVTKQSSYVMVASMEESVCSSPPPPQFVPYDSSYCGKISPIFITSLSYLILSVELLEVTPGSTLLIH